MYKDIGIYMHSGPLSPARDKYMSRCLWKAFHLGPGSYVCFPQRSSFIPSTFYFFYIFIIFKSFLFSKIFSLYPASFTPSFDSHISRKENQNLKCTLITSSIPSNFKRGFHPLVSIITLVPNLLAILSTQLQFQGTITFTNILLW